MKYKGIPLLPGKDSAAELLVHIWIPEEDADDDDAEEFVDCVLCVELESRLKQKGWNAAVEHEAGRLVTVRMDGGISFDREGTRFLVDCLYKEAEAYVESETDGFTAKIGVHVDAPGDDGVFYDADGNWFNEDSVTPEEFLANIDYQ